MPDALPDAQPTVSSIEGKYMLSNLMAEKWSIVLITEWQ